MIGKRSPSTVLFALATGAGILLTVAAMRGAEYDENYTLLLAAGTARPSWPANVFTAGQARAVFTGHSSLTGVAHNLRATDVHPPLYFWLVTLWRWLVGPSLFGVRLLSVVCSVVSLTFIGMIARSARIPSATAILITVGCYGFAYTGAIARGFALPQALILAGVLLALRTMNEPARRGLVIPCLAGLCLGAATFSNYLALFAASAILFVLLAWPRQWLATFIGFAVWVPADLWFFLAQRDSRTGQFPPFSLTEALPRLAQYGAANLFGGLPVYVEGTTRKLVTAGLMLGLMLLTFLVASRWHRIGTAPTRRLLAAAMLAPPVGLLVLGIVFNSTPIELRYLAFTTPFAGLLMAGALGTLLPVWRRGILIGILAVQSLSLAGLMTRQETMQPARATALASARLVGDGLVLLPRGNDGVGVVGAFVNEAPGALRMALVGPTDTATTLPTHISGASRVVLGLIGVDASSRASVETMRAAFLDQPCWRLAGVGFNVLAYDRICVGDQDVLRRIHADESGSSRR